MKKAFLVLVFLVVAILSVLIIIVIEGAMSSFKFIVYTDTHYGSASPGNARYEIKNLIKDRDAEFVFNVGDIVQDGCNESNWWEFAEGIQDICKSKDGIVFCWESEVYLDTNYYPVIGNHEMIANLFCKFNYSDYSECVFCKNQYYFKIFSFLQKYHYYSFGYKNSYFIVLDSNELDINNTSPQYNWLNEQLEISQNYDFAFVFFHHPPYALQENWSQLDIRELWNPLFEKYDVDIVFNGHTQHYARNYVNGVYYIISGGGGGALVNIEPEEFTIYSEKTFHYILMEIYDNKLVYEVYDTNDKLIDKLEI